MTKFAWASGATGTALGGAVAVVAVVGGVIVLQQSGDSESEQAAMQPAPVLSTPEPSNTPAPEPGPEPEVEKPAAVVQAQPEDSAPTDEPAAEPAVVPENTDEVADEPSVAPVIAEEPEDVETEVADVDEPSVEPAPEVAEDAAPEESPAQEPVVEEEIALATPEFDLVRIEADGSGLVAGKAEPGAEVSILLDGKVIETARADRQGKFAAFLTLPASGDPRFMTLNALLDGNELAGLSEVIIAPIAQPEPEPAPAPTPVAEAEAPVEVAEAEPADAPKIAEAKQETEEPVAEIAEAEQETEASITKTAEAVQEPQTSEPQEEEFAALEQPAEDVTPEPDAAPEPEPEATVEDEPTAEAPKPTPAAAPDIPAEQGGATPSLNSVILSGPEGVKVLQSGQPTLAGKDFVALNAITYEDDAVIVSGRATPTGPLNLYLDNKLVADAVVDATGAWSVDLRGVAAGRYTLRMDRVDDAGKVLARIESPFLREERASLIAATPETQGARAKAVTVQPGNTLWAIAREQFGDGVAYVRLFEANKDSIRDPDLIYPGQVFEIPN